MAIIEPGSPEWRKLITASKVPAILGVSPYSDAYTVFHEMKGNLPPFEGNSSTERGKYLEPAILAWFTDQHPDLTVTPNTETVFHATEAWACTPDGYTDDDALIEAKSYKYSDGFGQQGTADIPAYVLAQVAFQMIVTDARKVYVPVMFGDSFDFAEYVVEHADVAAFLPGIRTGIRDFEDFLAANEPPAPTGPAAYESARALHPLIDKATTVELADSVAVEYIDAVTAAKAAEARLSNAKAALTEAMDTAAKATWHGAAIASRISKSGGTPYVTAARTLPTTETIRSAA